ncbi:hypothetical protein ACPV4B_06520 [Vibrio parahaemolyticus]
MVRIHKPEGWVIIKETDGRIDSPACYRVFGSWAGGYTKGDYWRLSSGFYSTDGLTLEQGALTIPQYSGSTYVVRTGMQHRLTVYNLCILQSLIDKHVKENGPDATIEVLDINLESIDLIKMQLSD